MTTVAVATPVELNGAVVELNGHAVPSGHATSTNHRMISHQGTPTAQSTASFDHASAPLHGRSQGTGAARPARVDDDMARMKALGKNGQWREVMSVFRELQRGSEADFSLSPDLAVFNAAISAVAKSGRMDEVTC